MNKIVEFIIDLKVKIFREMSVSFGGVGGVLTTVFIEGTPLPPEPTLFHRAIDTVVLGTLGGIAGAIGGLIIAIVWAVYIKPWIKRKFGVDVHYKN